MRTWRVLSVWLLLLAVGVLLSGADAQQRGRRGSAAGSVHDLSDDDPDEFEGLDDQRGDQMPGKERGR